MSAPHKRMMERKTSLVKHRRTDAGASSTSTSGSVNATTTAEQLRRVASFGVLQWLNLHDILWLLSSCRDLRHDHALVHSVLATRTAFVSWYTRNALCVCDSVRHEVVSDERAFQACEGLGASLISLVGRMEAFLAARDRDSAADPAYEPTQAMLLPVNCDSLYTEYYQNPPSNLGKWQARVEPRTVFGAHWDSLEEFSTASRRMGDNVACRFCRAALDTICEYRDATEEFTCGFEKTLQSHENRWEQQGRGEDEIFELSFTFQEAYFGSEHYLNSRVAYRDDMAVLQHVCAHARFPLSRPFARGSRGFQHPPELLTALSFSTRERCRTTYRPLNAFMRELCTNMTRLSRPETAGTAMDIVVGTPTLYTRSLLVGFAIPVT